MTLAIKLQFGEKREQVWEVIDGHRAGIHDTGRTDEDRARLLMLHRDGHQADETYRRPHRPLTAATQRAKVGKQSWPLTPAKWMRTSCASTTRAAEESQRSSAALSLLNWGLRQREQRLWGQGYGVLAAGSRLGKR